MPLGLYFYATVDGATGSRLWKVQADGTVVQVPASPLTAGVATAGGQLYVVGADSTNFAGFVVSENLYVLQGPDSFVSATSFAPAPQPETSGYAGTLIDDPITLNASLYFSAEEGDKNKQLTSYSLSLWKATGSVTAKVADLGFGIVTKGASDATPFNGDVYFDSEGYVADIWKLKSDGTVVKVFETNGANADYFPPIQIFGVFNDKLYFRSIGHGGAFGAGAPELDAIDAAGNKSVVGVFSFDTGSFTPFNNEITNSPHDFVRFNSEFYFAADTLRKVKADGTLATVAANAYPSELTVFDGAIYFSSGTSARHLFTLLPGDSIQQVDSTGASTNFDPKHFFAFDSELYFSGNDGVTGAELWKVKADGTIVEVADINAGSGSSNPSSFTTFNSQLYFDASDGASGTELFKLKADGSVVRVADINPGAGSSNPAGFVLFDGPDYAPPASPHYATSILIGPHPSAWRPIVTADFNHDGTADLLWYNDNSTDVDLWKLTNSHWAGSSDIGTHPSGYQPAAFGDLNGDGTSDIAWFNPTTGDVDIWKIANGQWAGSVDVGPHPAGWQPLSSGDFNKDGTSDIAWYNPASNGIDIWKISNGQWAGSVDVGTHPAGYVPIGVGDVDHDGSSDIVWFNAATKDIDVWKIVDGHWAGSIDVGTHPAGWTPLAVADVTADGTADLVWYNAASGDIDVWKLSNGHWAGSTDVGSHPSGWNPVGVADVNHDGNADLLWHNPTNGQVETWVLVNV